MRLPVFVPTSFGPVSAYADLPDQGSVMSPAVLLLPGGRAGQDLLRKTARALGDGGRPALRFDYPGTGFAPQPDPFSHGDLVNLAAEVSRWWRQETGTGGLAVVGRCLGARIALWLAAREPNVTAAVAISCPIRESGLGRRIRRGIKAIDARGPDLATRLVRGPRVRTTVGVTQEADAFDVVADIVNAARSSKVRFVYGAGDRFRKDLEDLIESGTLPSDVVESIDISLLEEVELHGVPNVIHDDKLQELTVSTLIGSAEGAHRGE